MTAARYLVDRVLTSVYEGGVHKGMNVIAYSGGVDSSVVAACVQKVFGAERSVAALGVSPSLPKRQLEQAREVALEDIGIRLVEVSTSESTKPAYIANEGESCYHCKVSLYGDVLKDIASHFGQPKHLDDGREVGHFGQLRLFNGTNKDDLEDPTRLGLVAAREFNVLSPLENLTKAEVRIVAEALGLRTARIAASPCLRSRLAPGVRAIEEHLATVERAEEILRAQLNLHHSENLRFRMLRGGRYRVEVDAHRVDLAWSSLKSIEDIMHIPLAKLEVAPFKSGSVSKQPSTSHDLSTTTFLKSVPIVRNRGSL